MNLGCSRGTSQRSYLLARTHQDRSKGEYARPTDVLTPFVTSLPACCHDPSPSGRARVNDDWLWLTKDEWVGLVPEFFGLPCRDDQERGLFCIFEVVT